jgi:hypothetical protein
MIDVIYERAFRSPVTSTEALALAERLAHGIGADGARSDCLVSDDGHRMLCRFSVPNRGRGGPGSGRANNRGRRWWVGRVRRPQEESQADAKLIDVVGERELRTPMRSSGPTPIEQACRLCASVHRVHLVRIYVSLDGLRAIGIFRAPDAESVRLAYRGAGAPLDRVWPFHTARMQRALATPRPFAPTLQHGR